jgi:excinuclease UvrABC nuclease subunit
MNPELTQEMADALRAGKGEVRVTDPKTQQVYVLVDDETHRRAMEALRQQEDHRAIQSGLDDMQAGRSMSIEESHRRLDEALAQYKR